MFLSIQLRLADTVIPTNCPLNNAMIDFDIDLQPNKALKNLNEMYINSFYYNYCKVKYITLKQHFANHSNSE